MNNEKYKSFERAQVLIALYLLVMSGHRKDSPRETSPEKHPQRNTPREIPPEKHHREVKSRFHYLKVNHCEYVRLGEYGC